MGRFVACGVRAVLCGAVALGWAFGPGGEASAASPAGREASVIVGGGPASAVLASPGSVVCTQGAMVSDGAGRLGYLVPTLGPTVLRGSRDAEQTIHYRVVPADALSADLAADVTTCRAAR
jgi:hypothetical protein